MHSSSNNNRSHRNSDPYRAARRTLSPADSYDSSKLRSESDIHSRSASDSSTSRLTTSQPTYDHRRNDYYTDDPYAPRQTSHKHHTRKDTPESHHTTNSSSTIPSQEQQSDYYQAQKANSYLPYSHHQPGKKDHYYQPPATSMYLESEHLPSFTSPHNGGGVGSLLQDNIVMDMVDSPILTRRKEGLDRLPPLEEKKRRRFYGLGAKRLLIIVFIFIVIVVIVWYFVWPRTFTMTYVDTNLYGSAYQPIHPNNTVTGFQTTWNVSMMADNKENWVPTHVSRLDLDIYDQSTGVRFANGTYGSFVLPPKSQKPIDFIVNIDYDPAPNDQTLQDLSAACLAQLEPNDPSQPQPQSQQSLNLHFDVTYHIAGIAWTSQTRQNVGQFNCPT
ncbi:uncharacterized protein BX664DRAFT_388191 [Halteromyces radiatus]|uniref:uncharacterized protein n=1 Tax=Halteromyces radiatus TaxID=101107 RepID=UPI00221F706F|nr:uncharacterized protein BX664DRAFT_388191 [Halteromyces radiatus]KAI8083095.1 hypothetical protein BX664DRAFT_388191 [Halteromyces radiatus]